MTEFSHLIEYSSVPRKLVISRVFANGQKVLYTEIAIPVDMNKLQTKEFMAKVSEAIFIDTDAMRKALGL